MRIYVTGAVPSAIDCALAEDFEVVDAAEGADGILSLLTTAVDSALLDRAGPQLRIVANYAVGVNNIDLDSARARGVLVANTPDVLTRPTAELAVTLMLTLLRRVTEGDRMIRRREPWGFSLEFMLGESLDGKLVGIVGPGRIGLETARLVEAFGSRVVFGGRGDPLVELLAAADVVSLHCPLTPETQNLINAQRLGWMKHTAFLLNTSRGGLVDESALTEALPPSSIPSVRRRKRRGRFLA